MTTHREKYNHDNMSAEELEARIATDLYELSERLRVNTKTDAIGGLLWGIMRQIREAYRTAKLIMDEGE